jgi:hypothetical protein
VSDTTKVAGSAPAGFIKTVKLIDQPVVFKEDLIKNSFYLSLIFIFPLLLQPLCKNRNGYCRADITHKAP